MVDEHSRMPSASNSAHFTAHLDRQTRPIQELSLWSPAGYTAISSLSISLRLFPAIPCKSPYFSPVEQNDAPGYFFAVAVAIGYSE